MTGLPIESPFANDPNGAVKDADRDALGKRLNQAYESGTLPENEYRQLLDQLYDAGNRGELVPVAQALPAQYRSTGPAIGGDYVGPRPGEESNLPVAAPDNSPATRAAQPLLKFVAAGAGILLFLFIILIILL